jgi:hypothetical protein
MFSILSKKIHKHYIVILDFLRTQNVHFNLWYYYITSYKSNWMMENSLNMDNMNSWIQICMFFFWYARLNYKCNLSLVLSHLSMKQSSLFCFVLSRWDLPNYGVSCHDISILGKLLMNRGAPTWFKIVWSYGVEAIDYWIIFSIKINKTKTKNCNRIWGHFSWCLKTLGKPSLIDFISQFSELLVRYWFLSGFYCMKSKQIAKIWFGRKNLLSSQCVHT